MENTRVLDQLCINTIRALSADLPQAANSGHPGAPMGLAPLAHLLWTKVMTYNPANPHWPNRDRFILSNGHACALLYSMLHLSGYDLSMDDLKAFRKVGSKTPGHPEAGHTPGVEVTTGPLGQGLANSVGLAIAGAHLAATFNKPDYPLFDSHVYVVCGDGCLQEGITSEASSLAGHLGLGNLIVFYDDNNITIDGETNLSFTEDVLKRYESYGWHVQYVSNGDDDLDAIKKAINEAKAETKRPSFIKVKTTIGFGSKKAGTEGVHGSPLGEEDLAQLKTKFGLDPTAKFAVSDKVREVYSHCPEQGKKHEANWNALFERYKAAYPDLAAQLSRRLSGELPEGWEEGLPTWVADSPALATRQTSQAIINKLAERLPELIGGSADLNPSCLTYLKMSPDFQKGHEEGRNVRYGVREHAMAAVSNGIAQYGCGYIPFCSTFLNFIGYAWGAVILSALTKSQVLYIMTHDSIGLGEDGPTHQPVEKYALCRSTPHLLFLRPADGNETTAAYIAAIRHKGPSVLSLTRQALPHLAGSSVEVALRGAYPVLNCQGRPEIIFVATGSEVHLCLQAAPLLAPAKVRVISMPSWELFEDQDQEYKESVFDIDVPIVSVEAGVTLGWSRYAHAHVGVDRFGESGPAKAVFAHLGITPESIANKARALISYFSEHGSISAPIVPGLLPKFE